MSEEIQLLVLPEEDDLNAADIRFHYSPGMECPISDCPIKSSFPTKAKYSRHWEEKHEETANKLECPIKGCNSLVRRKSDMRSHINFKHGEKDQGRIEDILYKCTTKTVKSRGYVSPGFFKFDPRVKEEATRKRVASDLKSLVYSVNKESPNFNFEIVIPEKLPKIIMSTSTTASSTTRASTTGSSTTSTTASSTTRASTTGSTTATRVSSTSRASSTTGSSSTITTSSISSTSTSARPSLPVLPLFAKKTDSTTQTTIVDINNIYLPPIPTTIEDLEEYLRNLCNLMDNVGRLRESAKERLLDLKHRQPKVNTEREERRKLEAENRMLRNKLAEIKWREEIFARDAHEQ